MQRLSSSALVCVLSCFSRVWLFAAQWTVARQAPLSMGILQARILEWVAMSSCRGSSPPRDRTCVSYISCIGRWVLYCHLGSPLPSLPHHKMVKVEGWTVIQKVIREITFGVWSELWYRECNIWIFFFGGAYSVSCKISVPWPRELNPAHGSESAES